MNIRYPVRAGAFYEASTSSCRYHAAKLLDAVELPEDFLAQLPQSAKTPGGLVPHAGWMFSGRLAAMTFKALAATAPLETVVLFGADHAGVVSKGEVYDSGVWRTPLGEVAIDEQVASALLEEGGPLRANPEAHADEHAIEVQVPLIQQLAPEARIVPVAVPSAALAIDIGRVVGKVLASRFPTARVVGSTDLTHHGGHFPGPGGAGAVGEQWTRQNDRRILDLIESAAAEMILPEVREHSNACGAGAICATIAACKAMGATRGICLEYTNSYEVMHKLYPADPDDTTVGYASVVFV